MWEMTLMESFNLDNSYKQKLRFLEQKYASLLSKRSDNRKLNFLKRVNDALEDKDKIDILEGENEVLYELKKQWLLWILSKVNDIDKLKSIVAMFGKSGKDVSDKKALNEFNTILINSLLIDLEEYKKTKLAMEKLEWETPYWYKNWMLFNLISKNIRGSLKEVLEKWKWFLEEEKMDVGVDLPSISYQYDEDWNLIEDNVSGWTEEGVNESLSDSIRKSFVNPVVFFHTVQRIYQKYNYVITAEELWKLRKIFSDIKNGKMVFLTWDTWSGKTELCLLISHLYLDEIYWEWNKKEPVIVTWNSETDFSDFTMEKIVTSKNDLSVSDDALVIWMTEESWITEEGWITKKMRLKECAKSFVDRINKSEEIKDISREIVKDSNLSDEEKEDRLLEIDKQDLLKYNVFTEYHLQWMIKAMTLGVPLIIDEMNWIRPEVLLWLNHYFTRKVWQRVSLWNGFTPIKIQKWFCIMCTWNDKNENSRAKRYIWRYSIDESLMNRMHRICKWYHKQELKKFTNKNAWDLEEDIDMLDYMTKNELYGVILMLLFSKKGNKKFNQLWDKEFTKESATKLLTHTEVTAFDIIKEEFMDKNSNEEKKKIFFENLMKLASFIKMIQNAFQWKTTMCGSTDVKNKMVNSQWFSMRDLLNIINSYKNDTKSLRYHVYNEYIKQIPEDNEAREWVYLIAKEVWFLDKDVKIDLNSTSEITEDLERNLQNERQTSGKSSKTELMDVHNKKLEVSWQLLSDWRLIITKQDIYKEYFWDKFSDWIEVADEAIKEYEQEEQQSDSLSEGLESDENDYTVEEIVESCKTILSQKEDESYKKFFDALKWYESTILTEFCEQHQNEENVGAYSQEIINQIGKILNLISKMIEHSNDDDFDADLVNELVLSLNTTKWQQKQKNQ